MTFEKLDRADRLYRKIVAVTEISKEFNIGNVFIVCNEKRFLVDKELEKEILKLLEEKKLSLEKEFAEL